MYVLFNINIPVNPSSRNLHINGTIIYDTMCFPEDKYLNVHRPKLVPAIKIQTKIIEKVLSWFNQSFY